MTDLKDRVAIVTGAAAGIGLATARLFAKDGACVVLADIDEQAGRTAEHEISADGYNASFTRTDVSREEDVQAMIDFAISKFGRLDVLFNNAGISGEDGPVTQLDAGRWHQIIETNLSGTFYGMKHGIAGMLKGGGGSVINNASVLGLVGLANSAAYTASKGGVVQLTRTAALEFANKGVRVNCICPGFIETPMLTGASALDAARAAYLKVMQPMGRLGLAEEIAEMALFLASSRSSFMTGAVIPVDGGFTAR